MLSFQAKRFVESGYATTYKDGGGEHLDGYTIKYGKRSSRIRHGVKAQDAALLKDGKHVAFYDATSNEVY